jgi:hypothetical protein
MARLLTLAALALIVPGAAGADPFESKDGRYKVTFPNAPTESNKDVETAAGKLQLHIAALEVKKDLAFMVIWNDYPEAVAKEQAQAVLERVRDGSKGPDGKVVDDKEIALGKVPGRDFVLDKGDNHYYRSRSYLSSNRLYQVIISGVKKDSVGSKEAEAFLDSFEIGK